MRAIGLILFLLMIPACMSLPKIYDFQDPLTPKEHLALGVSYEYEGLPQRAIEEYEKVIALDSDDHGVIARVFLGNVHAGIGQFDTAERYYRDALSRNPRLGQALNNLAAIYVKQGIKLDEAESLARAALAQNEVGDKTYSAIYLETLGEVLLRQGRYKEALESFQRAEGFNEPPKPNRLAQLYRNMAQAYEGLGQTAEAQHARQRVEQLERAGGT